MLAHERVREMPCGCRYDTVSGTTTHFCRQHATHPFPWWYDFGTGEVVRSADGERFRTEDVPELERAARERNEVDVVAVDRWITAQPGKDR